MAKVEEVNSKKLNYSFDLNKFADLTQDEMKARYYGLGNLQAIKNVKDREPILASKRRLQSSTDYFDYFNVKAPERKDWHKEESLNVVKHQGGCGSCYAFATVISLEHAYYVKHGQKIKLSEQELVDCSKGHGNSGCTGGWMHQAFDYVLENGGLQTAKTYPYSATENHFCSRNASLNVPDLISGYRRLTAHDNEKIKRALTFAVVTAGVDVTDITFYSSGVYDNRQCRSDINHAIVIVGYGVSKSTGQKYWKIRNSWGDNWGRQGYFKLLRDDGFTEGVCGITQYNVYPTL
jgi:C1A family cysteine protease